MLTAVPCGVGLRRARPHVAVQSVDEIVVDVEEF